jgi:hypothetical protein
VSSPSLLVAVGAITISDCRHIASPNGVSTSRESGNVRSQYSCIRSSKASLGRCTRPGSRPSSKTSPEQHDIELPTFKPPPTPVISQSIDHQIPSVPRPYNVYPEVSKSGVIDNRDAVARAWLLPPSVPPVEDRVLDVLVALQTPTCAICHVRNYTVAFPESDTHFHHSACKECYRSKAGEMNAGCCLLPARPVLGLTRVSPPKTSWVRSGKPHWRSLQPLGSWRSVHACSIRTIHTIPVRIGASLLDAILEQGQYYHHLGPGS